MDRRRPFHKGRRSDLVKLALVVVFALFIILYLRAMFKQLDRLNSPDARSRRSKPPTGTGGTRGDDNSNFDRGEVAVDEVEGDLGALFRTPGKNPFQGHRNDPADGTQRSGEGQQVPDDTGFIQPLKVEAIVLAKNLTSAPPPRRKFAGLVDDALANIHAMPLSDGQRSLHFDEEASLLGNRILALYEGVQANRDDSEFFRSPSSSGLLIADALRWSVAAQQQGSLRSLALENISDVWTGPLQELRTLLQRFQSLNKEMRDGVRPAQYVLVHPVGQLCNRLMAITSAFLLALLTKRGLLIDDAGFYAQTSDLFLDPGFAWIATAEQMAVVMSDPMTLRIENPESGVWAETESLLCSDLHQRYSSHRHIDLSINQYFVPYLASNVHIRSDLLKIFRGAENLFFFSSHFLFRPIPLLQQQLGAFVEASFRGKFVVGLQVRSGQDFTSNFMSSADWKLYFSCAWTLVAESVPREDVLLFVATDTDQGRKAAVNELAALGWPSHQLRFGPGEFLNSNNVEGVQKALLDLMILSVCDDRVTTAWSSYGYFAAGFSGVPAAMIVDQPASLDERDLIAVGTLEQRFMGIPHKSDKRRQCVRLPVSQPCFHKFASWGAAASSCYTEEMRNREMLRGRYC
jgi:hypothetical protein